MTQADRVLSTPPTNTSANNPPGVMTHDDELGMAWWNALSEQQRAKWSAIAGNTGRVKDAWEAFKRGSVDQTPPVDHARRRFLTVAAVGSAIGAGTLAAAALTPNDVPQAVTVPGGRPNPELRAAIGRLARAHTALVVAQAAEEEAAAMFDDWLVQHPEPKSKRGKRRWIKQMGAFEREFMSAEFQALIAAEQAYATAQTTVAAIPLAGTSDLHAMAACSAIYDEVELNRHNRAPIARVVAQEYLRLGKAVQS